MCAGRPCEGGMRLEIKFRNPFLELINISKGFRSLAFYNAFWHKEGKNYYSKHSRRIAYQEASHCFHRFLCVCSEERNKQINNFEGIPRGVIRKNANRLLDVANTAILEAGCLTKINPNRNALPSAVKLIFCLPSHLSVGRQQETVIDTVRARLFDWCLLSW